MLSPLLLSAQNKQEVHDNGTFQVSVVNPNTLEAIYTEQDEKGGTIFKVVLKKKKP